MSDIIPSSITDGQKKGFSSPDASWFKGESIDFVSRMLLQPKSKIYEFLDQETVFTLCGEHLEGQENRRLLIWSLLSFGALVESESFQ